MRAVLGASGAPGTKKALTHALASASFVVKPLLNSILPQCSVYVGV